MLGDRLWQRDPETQPSRPGQVLERADLEQVRGHAGKRLLGIRRRRQAHLIADEDAAPDLAAHEALGPEGVDRRLHRLPRHAEEPGESWPDWSRVPGSS